MKWLRVLGLSTAVMLLSGCLITTNSDSDELDSDWAVECADEEPEVHINAFGDLELPCLGDKENTSLGIFDGQPMLIALWASWCGPCHEEAPHLQAFTELADGHVRVLGVDSEDQADAARAFAEEYDWTFPSVFDENGQVRKSLGIMGLPGIALVDADGSVVHVINETGITTDDLVDAANTHFDVSL